MSIVTLTFTTTLNYHIYGTQATATGLGGGAGGGFDILTIKLLPCWTNAFDSQGPVHWNFLDRNLSKSSKLERLAVRVTSTLVWPSASH
jgi:hypothetical protein